MVSIVQRHQAVFLMLVEFAPELLAVRRARVDDAHPDLGHRLVGVVPEPLNIHDQTRDREAHRCRVGEGEQLVSEGIGDQKQLSFQFLVRAYELAPDALGNSAR